MVFIKNAMFVVLNNVYIRISSNIKILMCIFKSFLVTLFVLWHCKWLKNMRPTFLFYLINFFISPLPWAVCSTLYVTFIWHRGKAMGKLCKMGWNCFSHMNIFPTMATSNMSLRFPINTLKIVYLPLQIMNGNTCRS